MGIASRLKLPLVAALLTCAGAASAAIVTLESVVAVPGGFQFNYEGSIAPDEGIISGNRLIIFDFAGYVPGSIFVPDANTVGSVELSSATPFIIPGQTDDPTLFNLVFTYVGPDFNNTGGPFPPTDFMNFGAVSIFSNTRLDAFTTFLVKNNPAASENTALLTLGVTQVPQVPEPAAWAMMITGFGMVGYAARRRRHTRSVTA